jgi:DHA1 family putative efflux transporter-like MFS transporter
MKKTNLTLIFFALMNFVLAMTSCAFNGILDIVADSLNISVANSGFLNTMYSYGAAFGVPITLIIFRRIERVRMLKVMLIITILTTVALVYAQSFGQLLIIRLIMGIAANSYGVLATSMVVALSTRERQGRSMAFYIAGSSMALVVGVPLTRALSAVFEWRTIFWILGIIMILSLVYFVMYLPKGDHSSTKLQLKKELQYFKDRKVLLIIAFTLIMYVGYNAFYTYITPYLLLLYPSLEATMGIILILLGVASFIGNLLGGYVSDHIGYAKSMLLGAVIQTILILLLLVFQPVRWLSVLLAILWIMSEWFTGLQLNTGIAQVTENKSSFMISINSSLLQLGCAVGSSLAAVVINLREIQNIILITLLASIILILLQCISMKKAS